MFILHGKLHTVAMKNLFMFSSVFKINIFLDIGEDSLWPWNAKKWIPLIPHHSLSCPLASPVGSCPPPVINLKQDVSRQLSSQSLLSLLRYRSVLCYRLSWLLSPLLMFLPRGKKETASCLNLQRARFQMTYNHLTIKIEVVRQRHLYVDTVVGSRKCSLIRGKNCGIALWVVGW